MPGECLFRFACGFFLLSLISPIDDNLPRVRFPPCGFPRLGVPFAGGTLSRILSLTLAGMHITTGLSGQLSSGCSDRPSYSSGAAPSGMIGEIDRRAPILRGVPLLRLSSIVSEIIASVKLYLLHM